MGSDVQEVVGSAIALSLLSGGHIPLWVGALLSAAASFTLLLIERVRFWLGQGACFQPSAVWSNS